MTGAMVVEPGGLDRDDVRALLTEHLAEMHATSPACSVHALDLTALQFPQFAVTKSFDELKAALDGAAARLASG